MAEAVSEAEPTQTALVSLQLGKVSSFVSGCLTSSSVYVGSVSSSA